MSMDLESLRSRFGSISLSQLYNRGNPCYPPIRFDEDDLTLSRFKDVVYMKHLSSEFHLPSEFTGTLPRGIYPLNFEDIAPGELLITVSVWLDNSMHIRHGQPFVIVGEPRKEYLESFLVDGESYYNGRKVELAYPSPYESLGTHHLSSYGLEELCNQWRTFRWSPSTEAYLRDLVHRQAFAEYHALIARPREEAVELATVSACSGASGGSSDGSQAAVARKRIGSTHALKQRFLMQGVKARIRANRSKELLAMDTNPDNAD